jgi:hypothetical protein
MYLPQASYFAAILEKVGVMAMGEDKLELNNFTADETNARNNLYKYYSRLGFKKFNDEGLMVATVYDVLNAKV